MTTLIHKRVQLSLLLSLLLFLLPLGGFGGMPLLLCAMDQDGSAS